MTDRLLVNILHDFGDPFESNAEWTGYDNVSFCGLDGQIVFYYPSLTDPVQTISWSSYDASDEAEATLFLELGKYEHGEVDAVYETDDGAIETVFWCDGDCAIFIDWYNKGDERSLTVSVYFY